MINFGSILFVKTTLKLSIFTHLFLKLCLRNLAHFSFDSTLHSAPSDSLKLSFRQYEKQVFLQFLLINFIKNSCWKLHKTNTNSSRTSAKLRSKFSIDFQCFWISFWCHLDAVLVPFWGSFGCQNDLQKHRELMLNFELNFADFFSEFVSEFRLVLCRFQHDLLMKFISRDCTKTCLSCRRKLNFKESEGAECDRESSGKSTKFREEI